MTHRINRRRHFLPPMSSSTTSPNLVTLRSIANEQIWSTEICKENPLECLAEGMVLGEVCKVGNELDDGGVGRYCERKEGNPDYDGQGDARL